MVAIEPSSWYIGWGGGRVSPNRPGPDITPANSKLPAITLSVTKNTEVQNTGQANNVPSDLNFSVGQYKHKT